MIGNQQIGLHDCSKSLSAYHQSGPDPSFGYSYVRSSQAPPHLAITKRSTDVEKSPSEIHPYIVNCAI